MLRINCGDYMFTNFHDKVFCIFVSLRDFLCGALLQKLKVCLVLLSLDIL